MFINMLSWMNFYPHWLSIAMRLIIFSNFQSVLFKLSQSFSLVDEVCAFSTSRFAFVDDYFIVVVMNIMSFFDAFIVR